MITSEAVPRRRVLLVSNVFPPLVAGGAPRMGQFARLLPEIGWDVTVLTARHAAGVSHDRQAVQTISERATVIEAWSPSAAVSQRGRPVVKHGIKGAARRALRTAMLSFVFPDREVFWAPAALAAGRRALRERPHDLILATYGPATNLLIGHALARAFQLPLVVDFRDLWSTLPLDKAFATSLHRAAALRIERSVVRAASKILAVAPKMAESLAVAHGIPTTDAVSITNGFDPDDTERVVDRRSAQSGPFRLMYTGSVHLHYDLDPFWRVLKVLAAEGVIEPSSFRVEFVGNLALDEVRKHGLEAFVEVKPFVARELLFDELARADALFVVEARGYNDMGYAAKVFDYLLTGKPVLGIVTTGGNTFRLLHDAGVGHCAEASDEASLRRQLESVLRLKGAPPREVDSDAEPLRPFNRRHLVAKLGRILDDVIATEPRGRW